MTPQATRIRISASFQLLANPVSASADMLERPTSWFSTLLSPNVGMLSPRTSDIVLFPCFPGGNAGHLARHLGDMLWPIGALDDRVLDLEDFFDEWWRIGLLDGARARQIDVEDMR